MDKTIKQLAESYGISKQAIRKHINQLPTGCYQVGTNKTIYVTEKGQQILHSKLSTNPRGKVSTVTINPTILELQQKIAILELEKELQDKSFNEKIDLIQAELSKRDEQIDNLMSLVEQTQKLLDQEQQLNAMNQQKLQLLENKSSKRSWWPFKKRDQE